MYIMQRVQSHVLNPFRVKLKILSEKLSSLFSFYTYPTLSSNYRSVFRKQKKITTPESSTMKYTSQAIVVKGILCQLRVLWRRHTTFCKRMVKYRLGNLQWKFLTKTRHEKSQEKFLRKILVLFENIKMRNKIFTFSENGEILQPENLADSLKKFNFQINHEWGLLTRKDSWKAFIIIPILLVPSFRSS